MEEDLKVIEGEIVSVYEGKNGEKLINARELHKELGNKRKFADWIKQRIEQYDFVENVEFICFHKFVKANKYGNKSLKEYYLTIDMAKELCMVENNMKGKILRKYFIEVEKRYRSIVENPQNIFDVMRIALDQIEANEKRLKLIESETKENKQELSLAKVEIQEIKRKIDVIIQKDYCLASDIAEELEIYSENDLPHSNFIGAIQTKANGTSTLIPTGQTTAVCNIYDMGGNVYEWTSEHATTYPYTVRGSSYATSYAKCPAGHRFQFTNNVDIAIGFRITLFL